MGQDEHSWLTQQAVTTNNENAFWFVDWASPSGKSLKQSSWKRHFTSDFPRQLGTLSHSLKNSTPSRVSLESLFLWSFQSDLSSFGDNPGHWRGQVLEMGLYPHLVSRKWITLLAVDSRISYLEIWTLGPMYSEVCHGHLLKPWHRAPPFMSGVRQRSVLNDCQPDDKASYYRGVVSPGLKTHSGGTEACRGEDKI